MKRIQSLFIAIVFLILGATSVLAEKSEVVQVKQPTSYINEQGESAPIPTTGKGLQPIPTSDDSNSLVTTEGQNWYWAGQQIPEPEGTLTDQDASGKEGDTTYSSAEVENGISIQAPSTGTTGTVNIVVGPNGGNGTPAMTITGGLTIPANVIVKIYQAADGLTVNNETTTPLTKNCLLEIVGQEAEAESDTTPDPQPIGIEVQGKGTLEVVSGAIDGQGATGSTGLQVDPGATATVSGGQLQGESPAQSEMSQTAGITIQSSSNGTSNGSITVSGGLLFSAVDSQQALNTTGAPISGLQHLTVNNGTVWSSDTFESVTTGAAKPTLNGGSWLNFNGNSKIFNTFGTNPSTLALGVYEIFNMGSQCQFNVNENTNVTIPSEIGLNFENGGIMTINGTATVANQGNFSYGLWFDAPPSSISDKVPAVTTGGSSLKIGTNGILNIEPAGEVTMGSKSILSNSGIINVETQSEQTPTN